MPPALPLTFKLCLDTLEFPMETVEFLLVLRVLALHQTVFSNQSGLQIGHTPKCIRQIVI